MKPQTLWQRVGRAVRDRSFIIGTILVSIFIVAAVLGPELAPHNPFQRDRIQTIDGELYRAPIPPNALYPLGTDDQGRDVLSLLLYGARQTLVIAFVAVTIRLILGLLLGTISGWWPNSTFDRAVTALTEFLAAIPALILAILLVSAVGIRRGQIAFIVALSLVGWGEVSQIVRGNVLTLRNKLFILASRSLGLGSAEILSRHVLPNLLATLLALAALEMGAVLLLLGELGFVHIFIGGGGLYLDEAIGVIHYFEIPDWGAMLGTSWRYFRSLPWLPLAPAFSFFIAILGFNLFGYGLQRFIEKGRFHPSGWSVLRFIVVVALVLWGAQALLASSSVEAQFEKTAREFNLQRAWDHISYLTQPELGGRVTGDGGRDAAGYIAHHFDQAGLTIMPEGGYYQSYVAQRPEILVPPSVEVIGDDGQAVLRFEGNEILFDPLEPFESEWGAEGELAVLGNILDRDVVDAAEEKVLMLLDIREDAPSPLWFRDQVYGAVLHVVPDAEIPQASQPPSLEGSVYLHEYPSLLITESAARQVLAEAGLDLDALQNQMESGEKVILETDLQIRVEAGLAYEPTPAVNVVGYFPAADIRTQGDRIMVVAQYTNPEAPGDRVYPGADENASAVAVMLEIARLWHEEGFEPKRTVIFVAADENGANYLSNHAFLPTGSGDTWTVVTLHGLGAGEPELSYSESMGGGLTRLLQDSAHRFGADTGQMTDWWFFFEGNVRTRRGRRSQSYSGISITRVGDELSGTTMDTIDHLDPGMVAEAGKVIGHYLMVVSSR
ncbi:MAG: ABC transporter permease subunit [Anaerolineae bacterium]|jgi:peptide/nickel transport system permease protein